KDAMSIPAMRKIVASDPSPKARVAAMDALAMFKGDAVSAVPIVAKELDHSDWQMRVAAAQALGGIDSMEGIEPLITRMEFESGRVSNDIYEALRKVSHDDLGRKPQSWRKWWEGTGGSHLPPPRLIGLEIY